MKNTTIKIDPIGFDDIVVIGINSHLIDYKLAWLINSKLSFQLVREKDIFRNGAQYAFYFYDSDKEGNGPVYNLVSLKCKGTYWRNALPRIDFLLIIRNKINSNKLEEIIDKLNAIEGVGHAFLIDLYADNSLAAILETIEGHEVDILDEKRKETDIDYVKAKVKEKEEERQKMLSQLY